MGVAYLSRMTPNPLKCWLLVVAYIPLNFSFICGGSEVLIRNWKDTEFSILPTYKKLIAAGLRIWVFRYESAKFTGQKF